jgi:hypothetical protein
MSKSKRKSKASRVRSHWQKLMAREQYRQQQHLADCGAGCNEIASQFRQLKELRAER